MMVEDWEFSAREEILAGLDRNIVTVLDWIVLEGGHHDEQKLGEENLDEAERPASPGAHQGRTPC